MEHPLRRPELLVCAWHGHVLPGATVDPLEARHAVLASATQDGGRLAQCLRCRDWVVVAPPAPGTGFPIASIDEVELPRRGRALRQALTVRVIAFDRAVHTVAFGFVTAAALALRWNLTGIKGWANGVLASLRSAQHGSGGVSTHGLTAALLTRLANVRPHSLLVLAVFAGAYTAVSACEAVGLWFERRWAEYLTALATAGFLPFEVRELVDRVTVVRAGAMVVNLAILVYLVVAKHLFGIGGPVQYDDPEPLRPVQFAGAPGETF